VAFMLKYLIQVVQNLLTTSILLAMLFAHIQLIGSKKQKRWLIWGLVAGGAAAVVLSVLKYTTVLINREFFNMGILSVTILAEIIFLFFSWGCFFRKMPVLREKVWNIINLTVVLFWIFYILPDILLYPTEFVMAGESAFSTNFLYKFIGYAAGIILVTFIGVALFKICKNLSVQMVRILFTAGIVIIMVNQTAMILQLMLARRIIPMSKWLFSLLIPIINYNEYFLYGIMAITIAFPIVLYVKNINSRWTFSNPAEHRKIKAASRRSRRWSVAILTGYVLAVLSLTVVKAYSEKEVVLSPAEPMSISGSDILISIENVSDGHLHRFAYTASDGTEMRFIVIKKNGATYGVGLDACDICGPTGYYERRDGVVCKLCDVIMNTATIGFKGGCNPVPLTYAVKNGKMVIETKNLENEKKRFQ